MGNVVLTIGITVHQNTIENSFKRIINQVYKLLPLREEGKNWEKPLRTIIEQLAGMSRLIGDQDQLYFSILCKMEGLFSLSNDSDMQEYRRIILELLGLLNTLRDNVCAR